MDRDLALAVFRSFQDGERINDTMLEKAATALQIDPSYVLREARIKTAASNMHKKANFDYLAKRCGFSEDRLQKVAHMVDATKEQVLMTYLQGIDFSPYEKIAEEAPAQGQNLQQDPTALATPALPPTALTSQDPFGNPMFRPTPTAPNQVPPSEEGNAQQLMENDANKEQIQNEQAQLGADQMLQQAGQGQQQMPKEQIQQALAQADPEAKMRYAFPGATEQEMSRAVEALNMVEQQTGLSVTDEGQLKKIVSEVQKENKKIIDEAIKMQFGGQGGAGGGAPTGPLPGSPENPIAGQQQQGQEDPSQGAQPDMQKLARKIRFLRFP